MFLFFILPFQNVSVVIGQVTSANELWDLNGFGHSWEEKRLCLLHFVTRWQHQRTSGWWTKLGEIKERR